jgi:hypothetical protein
VSQCFKNCIFRDSYLKSATPDFGSIEVEVRTQMLEIVGPTMGEFFFSEGGKNGLEPTFRRLPPPIE